MWGEKSKIAGWGRLGGVLRIKKENTEVETHVILIEKTRDFMKDSHVAIESCIAVATQS